MDTKVDQYAQDKREQMFALLAKNKWWKQDYDPRPIHPQDVIKTSGKENLELRLKNAGQVDDFLQAIDASLDDFVSAPANGLMVQPGFEMDQGMGTPYKSDVFIQASQDRTIRVPAEVMNTYFQPPQIPNFMDRNVVKRAFPIEAEQTNLEAFQELFAQEGMDDPRLVPAYKWMIGAFQHGNLDKHDVDTMVEAAPWIEWQRRFNPAQDVPLLRPFNFAPPNRHVDPRDLSQWVTGLEDKRLDPTTDILGWEDDAVWQKGEFTVAALNDEDDFIQHGDMLAHCINNVDGQPYWAMQEQGHWQHYALRDKTGRPCATICLHKAQAKWTVMENRGPSGGLEPAKQLTGKGKMYQDAIAEWFTSIEQQGIVVDRSGENDHVPSVHPQFGMQAFGYRKEFNGTLEEMHIEDWDKREMLHDGRLGEIRPENLDELEEYWIEITEHSEHFFDSEPVPNYDQEVMEYSPANKINVSDKYMQDIVEEICNLSPSERTDQTLSHYVFTIGLLLEHHDQQHGETYREMNMDDLADHCTQHAEYLEKYGVDTEDVKYDVAHKHQNYRDQLDLEFEEEDIQEWPKKVSEYIIRATQFHWSMDLPSDYTDQTPNIALLKEQYDAHMQGLEQKPRLSKAELEVFDKTVIDNPKQKELFMPTFEEENLTREQSWKKYYGSPSQEPKPHIGWKPLD